MEAVLLSATPLVLSLSLPNTSRHSLTPAMASPMSWHFIPLFRILAPLSRASLSPRTVDSFHNTDTNRRIVWHQSSQFGVVASVRIGELGLCIGRLFRYVIVLKMACSSSSLSGEGFVHLCCSSKCPCSALSVPWSILRCRRHCFLCSVGRDTLASSWSFSPSLLSLFNVSEISPPASCSYSLGHRRVIQLSKHDSFVLSVPGSGSLTPILNFTRHFVRLTDAHLVSQTSAP